MLLFQCAIAGKMCIFPTFILIWCIVSLCALFGVTAAGDELSCGLFFCIGGAYYVSYKYHRPYFCL